MSHARQIIAVGTSRAAAVVVAMLISAEFAVVQAQCFGGGGGRRQSVGGVFIDASGVLNNAEVDQLNELRQVLTQAMREQPGDLVQPAELRKISLRKLEEAIADAIQLGKPLSDEVRHLAGLQTIRYVLVYPEERDIVLVGFGEGWTVDKRGFVVGRTTGKPTLLLDDLLVALRAAGRDGNSISCSIDPTEAGLKSLRQYAATLSQIGDVSTQRIEQLLGPQTISVGGVPATSHFARVLVAADYRMKRIGMNLEPSRVSGLPSYVAMIPGGGRGMQSMTPRWWLVPSYAPLLTDAEGLAWELRGSSVKTMTQDTLFSADGSKAQTGKSSPIAQQWANMMTSHYEQLAIKEPIFAQLRSCMDLAVIAALIHKEKLPGKAGYSFSVLIDPTQLAAREYEPPKTTPSKVSILQKGGSYVLSASGGVEIRPDQFLKNVELGPSLSPVRNAAAPAAANQRWWWN